MLRFGESTESKSKLVNRRMLNTHEYCLVFNRKTQPELREFYDKKLNEDENLSKETKTNDFF